MNRPGRNTTLDRGVALITALLVVAIATVAAVAMASRQQLDIRRSANLVNGEQAYQLALGVEAWATQVLVRDLQRNRIDHLGETWALDLAPIDVEGGRVAGQIEDLQGRFNLNSLLRKQGDTYQPNPKSIRYFQRLLVRAELPPEIAGAVVDWIDENIEPYPDGGAEDDVYTQLDPPYRPANTLMKSPSELLQVHGMTREGYVKLAPYLAALPVPNGSIGTAINVNTAPLPVLLALSDNILPNTLEAALQRREAKPFSSTGEFIQMLLPDITLDANAQTAPLGVSSDYFLVVADAEFGRGRARLLSVIQRGQENGKAEVLLHGLGAW